MIPTTIHYCWFGGKSKPRLAEKCIKSWKKHCPAYDIIESNEDNFDVNIIPFTKEAYAAGKFAFVNDYARLWVLYHHGGIY
ncbi:MAG TPA: capsular polysaccharide synthesis protein, partial [Clostridia bacterium]|nr:capsular polysaccharide synthesis protein [Clostridia bacterium]